MRTGITITVSPAGRRRLLALVKDRNASQKHVWRAEIVLLSAGGAGTNAIMRQTGKSKTCVWRWQERFATEGFEGLLRDKTRPSRIKPLGDDVAALSSTNCAMSSGSMSIRPPMPSCCQLTKRARFKRSTARNLAYR